MSLTAVVAGAALLASVTTTHPAISVTAGPAKIAAAPGAVVMQRVANHGTLPERITIGVDEIGRTVAGACSFTHAPPLATTDRSSVDLAPGQAADIRVAIAKTAPTPGWHDITVDYTVSGTGAVKVAQGVATQVVVKYPGSDRIPGPAGVRRDRARPASRPAGRPHRGRARPARRARHPGRPDPPHRPQAPRPDRTGRQLTHPARPRTPGPGLAPTD